MSVVIKVFPDQDQYVIWSHTCDLPTVHGDRAAVTRWLTRHERYCHPGDVQAMMRRADATGTSSPQGTEGWYDEYLIMEQRGLLPRARLWELCQAYFGGPDRRDEWLDMLIPFDDCEHHEACEDPASCRVVNRG